MNKIWICIIILLAIFIGSFFYIHYINQLTDTMQSMVTKTAEYADTQPDKIPENIQRLLQYLEQNKAILCLFIDHRMINDIECNAKLAMQNYENNETDKLKETLVLLSEHISEIKELETIDFKNIL